MVEKGGKSLKQLKKVFTILIISLTALFLIFKFIVYPYLNACINARDEVAYYAEALMISPESANKIISYDMLPKKYQSEISLEEYQNADEPTELLELYSNPVFKQNRKRRVSIELSTEGCKKTAEGYFKAGDKWYYVSHEIDVIPAFFTLKPKIVRWNIEITEEEIP